MSKIFGQNVDKEPLRVLHSGLKRISSESSFRSECPTCKSGFLLVGRDRNNFNLLRNDSCILCGQRVVYLDRDIAGEILHSV